VNSFSKENFNYFSFSYETDLEPKRGFKEFEFSATVLYTDFYSSLIKELI
jgi:hypothetical protein